MKATDKLHDLDLGAIAEVRRRGSVIASWLLDLTADALLKDPELSKRRGARWNLWAIMLRHFMASVVRCPSSLHHSAWLDSRTRTKRPLRATLCRGAICFRT